MIPRLVVGVTGGMRSGKDTFAAALRAYADKQRWLTLSYSFADPLKDAVRAIFGGERSNYYGPDCERNMLLPAVWREAVGDKFTTYRTALRWVGTELFRRHLSPDIWTVACRSFIETVTEGCAAVENRPGLLITVPDVRFDNEARMIRELRGVVVHVQRMDGAIAEGGLPGHASEAGVSPNIVDHRFAISANGHAAAAETLFRQLADVP